MTLKEYLKKIDREDTYEIYVKYHDFSINGDDNTFFEWDKIRWNIIHRISLEVTSLQREINLLTHAWNIDKDKQ